VGLERGACTGAAGGRPGLLQMADRGTVFLDEVGDLGLNAQAKMLRAIETREVYPLGGKKPVALDVRLVAATNHNLEAAVDEGRFRKDLYFRLNVVRIHLPPLRERRSGCCSTITCGRSIESRTASTASTTKRATCSRRTTGRATCASSGTSSKRFSWRRRNARSASPICRKHFARAFARRPAPPPSA